VPAGEERQDAQALSGNCLSPPTITAKLAGVCSEGMEAQASRPIDAAANTPRRFMDEIAQFKRGLEYRSKRHAGIKAYVLPVEQAA
jgi:hypothetical protein